MDTDNAWFAAVRPPHPHGVWLSGGPGWPPPPPAPPGPPGVPPPGWPGHPGAPQVRVWRGHRARSGDVRAAILALLAERPLNGYQVIQEIGARSRGVWRPSSGSVYPALQQLEDEGLVRAEEAGGRRLFHLTEEGRVHVEAHRDELAAPWDAAGDSVHDRAHELMAQVGELSGAVTQVAHSGTDAQVAEARRMLGRTKRAIYRLLATEPEGEEEDADPE